MTRYKKHLIQILSESTRFINAWHNIALYMAFLHAYMYFTISIFHNIALYMAFLHAFHYFYISGSIVIITQEFTKSIYICIENIHFNVC